MTRIRIVKYLLRLTGLGCILWALAIVQGFHQEEIRAQDAVVTISEQMAQLPISKPVASEDFAMAVKEIEGVAYIGQIRIPSQKLLLPVAATYSLQQMSETPTLYKGSYYQDDLVICAHNYRHHFEALENIEIGEQLAIETVDGQVITYVITNREIIQPTQVHSVDKIAGKDDWDLTLFTCTPSGLQRILIRCERVEV